MDGMKDTPTRRYNAFLVRPALHEARVGTLTILHVQSGEVALAVAPGAAVGWIQRLTAARQPGPNQTSRDDNQQYGALSSSKKERATMTATETQASLYEQLGGRESIAAVVEEFYRRVLADDGLSPLFAQLDMTQQRRHLAAFLVAALGGPNEYRGRGLRQAHQGLGITPGQFGAVAGHLQATLAAFAVPESLIATVLGAVAGLQSDIVGL
jgi:hemoglobin